ncbi:MAG: efflux RND transporter periplasmic adaptor subunit [Geminicoccaceae bacterium]
MLFQAFSTARLRSVVLAMAVCALSGCDDGDSNAQAARAAPPPAEVTVSKPLIRRLTEWDEFTGRFEPVQVVEIKARVPGYLQEIGFKDGQNVEAGQALFTIDPRPFEAALDRTKAQIELAQAQLRLAQLDQDRAAKLVSTSAIAKATLDQRDAELSEAGANLDQAKAQARDAELNLGFTRITAPFAGRVSDRRADIGNLVDNTLVLTTIVQLDPIYLSFDMSEQDFLAYQRAAAKGDLPSTRNQETIVEAHLVDEDGWPHQGTMNFVDNVVDQGSGTIRGRAVFPNPDGLITPGQFGRIRIPGSPEYDAILIPDAAIVTDQSRKMVLTVDAENVVRPKIIRPGPSQPGGLRIVRRGLEPDDRIIINGLIRARPGVKVAPKDGTIEPEATEPAAG